MLMFMFVLMLMCSVCHGFVSGSNGFQFVSNALVFLDLFTIILVWASVAYERVN